MCLTYVKKFGELIENIKWSLQMKGRVYENQGFVFMKYGSNLMFNGELKMQISGGWKSGRLWNAV